MIPKIIHQMGPENKLNWHPIWEDCRQSWLEQFPEPYYQHIFWTDSDLRNLVKESYFEFLDFYDEFPIEAFRIDFSRFCILHKYGGIYADLDFFCYKNFFKELVDDIYLLESKKEWDELVQNSLMASCPQHEFWIECMNLSKQKFFHIPEHHRSSRGLDYIKSFEDNEEFCDSVKYSTGPGLISDVYKITKTGLFPLEEYHPFDHYSFFRSGDEISMKRYLELKYKYNTGSQIKCRHFLSGIWGKEIIQNNPNRVVGGSIK